MNDADAEAYAGHARPIPRPARVSASVSPMSQRPEVGRPEVERPKAPEVSEPAAPPTIATPTIATLPTLTSDPNRRFAKILVADVWIPTFTARDYLPNGKPRWGEHDDEETIGMAKSIKAIGLIEPIVVVARLEVRCAECQKTNTIAVCVHKRRPYMLVAGKRRLRAHQIAEIIEIEAAVELAMSNERIEDVSWHENVERLQLSVWDYYREILARRQRNPKETLKRLAERTDLSESFVNECVEISAKVAPDLVVVLRSDARAEVFRHLAMAAKIEAPSDHERHALQHKWWDAEGWKTKLPSRSNGGKGGGPRKRMSVRDVERLARRIEDDRVIEAGGDRVEVGARQARIVAALLRWTVTPPNAVGGGRAGIGARSTDLDDELGEALDGAASGSARVANGRAVR